MRNEEKNLSAAADFWAQHFGNMSKHRNAALWDPEFDMEAGEAKLALALANAGWTPEEISARIEGDRDNWTDAPVTSPGVNPHVESWLDTLGNSIEDAMERRGMQSHKTLARGIEPFGGVIATKTNVIMTEESVITVGAFLFRFCGLIARAFARTLRLNPWFWAGESYTEHSARALLRQDRTQQLGYWHSIFASYAVSGTHAFVPFLPATKEEVVLFEQVAHAMEIFAIAHEYGHHHHNHGRTTDENPFADEFSADAFATNIMMEVGTDMLGLPSPYLQSGAGGIVLLLSLDILADATAIASGIPRETSATHPSHEVRVQRIFRHRSFARDEYARLHEFRTASRRLMTVVGKEMKPLFFKTGPVMKQRHAAIWNE